MFDKKTNHSEEGIMMPDMSSAHTHFAADCTNDTYRDLEDYDRRTFTSGLSVTSNVDSYRYENGRRYHSYKADNFAYYAPNDDKYQSYEAVVHHLWLLTLGDRLFLAPIENPQTILDVGTGTGLWAVDMADHFPSAEIIGTDLSPDKATTAPPNIRFEVDDASAEWTYPESSFDFVHVRGMTGCIQDWPYFYQQSFKHLKPGGYLEHLEFSVRTNADPNSDNHADKMYTAFTESFIAVGEKRGITFLTMENMLGYMQDAGFTDIHEEKFIWPIGPWHPDPHLQEVGRLGERNWAEGFESWILALYTGVLGWTLAEVKAHAADMRAVIKDRNNRFYHEVRCVYGRKPTSEETASQSGHGEDV